MTFHQQGPLSKAKAETSEARVANSRRTKKAPVNEGHSHGILMYSGGEPVGWCQYGPKEELPRVDAGIIYRRLSQGSCDEMLWRITCFWTDRRHRNQGIAGGALKAA